MEILRSLVTDEYLKGGSGYIGIGLLDDIANVPGDPKSRSVIRITNVQPGTPGQRAGLRLNDLIVGFEGEVWYEMNAQALFQQKILAMKPETKVGLKILRNAALMDITVKLIRRPVIIQNGLFLNGQNIDTDGAERAAQEAYFRQWLSERGSKKGS